MNTRPTAIARPLDDSPPDADPSSDTALHTDLPDETAAPCAAPRGRAWRKTLAIVGLGLCAFATFATCVVGVHIKRQLAEIIGQGDPMNPEHRKYCHPEPSTDEFIADCFYDGRNPVGDAPNRP